MVSLVWKSFWLIEAGPHRGRVHFITTDHRGIKRVTRPMLGFKSFEAAQGTLVGIELMHMIKKRQLQSVSNDFALTPSGFSDVHRLR